VLITFSTFLTLFRIFLTPFIAVAMIMHYWVVAIVLFSSAVLTDLFDGYFARLWGQETQFGAYLDPLADKILITTCYAGLVFVPIPGLVVPVWFLALVLAKEILLLIGAGYFGLIRHTITIKPSLWGKLAMVVQSLLVVWLLACSSFHWVPVRTFNVFLAIAVVFVVGSFIHYVLGVLPVFSGCKWFGFFLLGIGAVFCCMVAQDSFLAEPGSGVVGVKKEIKEKKYSELYDELFESYEAILHEYSALIRRLTFEQEAAMDAVHKLAQNTPRMGRDRLIKELERIKKARQQIQTCVFM
jgi:cardiolipin synthase